MDHQGERRPWREFLLFEDDEADPAGRAALDEILAGHGRVTNMKRTLARSPVALHALMTWYDLREAVVPFLGERLDDALRPCHLRRDRLPGLLDLLPPAPDRLGRGPRGTRLDDWEQTIVDYGRQLAVDPHGVSDELFGRLAARLRPEEIVALTAFGGLMVATNLFNNALRVDLDDYCMDTASGRNEHGGIGRESSRIDFGPGRTGCFHHRRGARTGPGDGDRVGPRGGPGRGPGRRPADGLSRLSDGLGRRARNARPGVPRLGRNA